MTGRQRVSIGAGDVGTAVALVLGAALCAWGLWDGIVRASLEAELKMSQKIFYFHAPLGIWTVMGSVVAAVAAVVYLWKRDPRADLLSAACLDVCLVTCGVVLVTGSLWARPAWGDWFPWGEPRVTSMLVLFLLLMAYRAVRSSVDEFDKRARFSAVMAIMGAVVAMFAYFAIHIWQTTHPRVITLQGVGLPPDMARAFVTCIGATFFLVALLVQARYRLSLLSFSVDRLEHEAEEAREGA
jgi:heme exporter protein C